jgi:NAD(P)-dependent dehydrogenase (short-subunit alcohol dehydrogenase family)
MFGLAGKTAVVTGGGSGIGEAIARRFKAAGANVVVGDLNDSTEGSAKWGGHFRRTDVTRDADIAALLDDAIARFGALDILVNNAGIALTGDIEHVGSEAAERMYRINTASIAGEVGIPGLVEYSMGKAAIIQATKVAALDLGARNIRVNAICPGVIVTPLSVNADAPLVALAPHVTALERAGVPSEVAALAHFLASDDASYITGQAIFVDGGWNIGMTVPTVMAGVAAAR